ncbi:hypothetical protein J6590_010896 [Homalodisca vitripennis]|nr:hypothetical protein J6590_010896 [Homalodisca vitripennis]
MRLEGLPSFSSQGCWRFAVKVCQERGLCCGEWLGGGGEGEGLVGGGLKGSSSLSGTRHEAPDTAGEMQNFCQSEPSELTYLSKNDNSFHAQKHFRNKRSSPRHSNSMSWTASYRAIAQNILRKRLKYSWGDFLEAEIKNVHVNHTQP